MDTSTKLFLELIRDYIKQDSSKETVREHIDMIDEKIDWEAIVKLSINNNTFPFIYHQIKAFDGQYNISPGLLIGLKNRIIRMSSKQIMATEYLIKIIEALKLADVPFMILKGITLAEMYPHPDYRYSCDSDIHILSDEFEKVDKIIKDLGYKFSYNNIVQYEYSYSLHGVHIDLHTRLFEDFYDKYIDIFDEYGFDSLKHTEVHTLSGNDYLTLKPNEFFIHIICHMTKHFVGTGINLRYLIDISIFVNNHINHLDMNYIMEFLTKIKSERFVLNILYICNVYLGMIKIDCINYDSIDMDIINDLLIDFVENIKESHSHLTQTTSFFAYYKNEKDVMKNRIFPNRKILSDKYSYAKKHVWLIGFAWIQRAFNHILRVIRTPKDIKSLKGSKRRIKLLKKLGLI